MNYDSNIDPIGLGSIREETEYEQCEMDQQYYEKREMAFDKDEFIWIHKSNIEQYLKNCEPFMLLPDFEALRDNLLKQIK